MRVKKGATGEQHAAEITSCQLNSAGYRGVLRCVPGGRLLHG
jgi:hypothetical protein